MNRPKQFPRWLGWTIEIMGVAIGAWYVFNGIVAWLSQWSGAG